MKDMKLRRLQKFKKEDERYGAMDVAELIIWNRGRKDRRKKERKKKGKREKKEKKMEGERIKGSWVCMMKKENE